MLLYVAVDGYLMQPQDFICMLFQIINYIGILIQPLFMQYGLSFVTGKNALWLQSFLETGLIVAGWDKYEGGSVYGIPLGGTLLRLPFATGGLYFHRTISVWIPPGVEFWYLMIVDDVLRAQSKPPNR